MVRKADRNFKLYENTQGEKFLLQIPAGILPMAVSKTKLWKLAGFESQTALVSLWKNYFWISMLLFPVPFVSIVTMLLLNPWNLRELFLNSYAFYFFIVALIVYLGIELPFIVLNFMMEKSFKKLRAKGLLALANDARGIDMKEASLIQIRWEVSFIGVYFLILVTATRSDLFPIWLSLCLRVFLPVVLVAVAGSLFREFSFRSQTKKIFNRELKTES